MPVDIYKYLGDQYLYCLEKYYLTKEENHLKYVFYSNNDREFGFTHKPNYDNLMSQSPVQRPKQGCLDIFINTGDKYNFYDNSNAISHYKMFADITNNPNLTLNYCYKVWRGEDPREFIIDEDTKQSLISLLLLFFEQEINWGNNCWQKRTAFPPYSKYPNKTRPRDMIMGFICQIFDQKKGVDTIEHWKHSKDNRYKMTPTFGGRYKDYPNDLKLYFNRLENDTTAQPLMISKYWSRFNNIVEKYITENNKNYVQPKK